MTERIDDSALFHGAAYDPVKAREYYLRTRKLKGRRHGVADAPKGRPGAGGQPRPSVHPGKSAQAKAKSRRAELEARKNALEKRLDHLKKVLHELVAAAKKRSGVHEKSKAPENKADKADRNKAEKGKKPLTAHQKSVKAKKAKEAYEKEHPKSLSKDIEVLQEQIKDIEVKIRKAMADAQHRGNKAGKHDSKSGSKNHQTSGPRGR